MRRGGLALAAAAVLFTAFPAGAAAPAQTAEVNGVAVGQLMAEPAGAYISLSGVARALGYEVQRVGADSVNLERPGALNPPPILIHPGQAVLSGADLGGFKLNSTTEASNSDLIAEVPGIETAIEDEGRLDGAEYDYTEPAAQILQSGGPSEVLIALNEFSTWAGASSAVNAFQVELKGLSGSKKIPNGRLGTIGDTSVAYQVLTKKGATQTRTLYLEARVNNWELIVIADGAPQVFGARNLWPIAALQAGKIAAMGGAPIQ